MPEIIPISELAQRFTHALCATPYAQMFPLDHVSQAAAQFQTLAQKVAPHLEGGLMLTQDDIQQLAKRYIDEYYLASRKGRLTDIFSGHFLRRAQGLKPEHLESLAQDLGVSTESLQRWARTADKVIVGGVFARVSNVSMGLAHTFTFKPGVDRKRNWGAGALGYAGLIATLDGARRALIGTDATPTDADGEPIGPLQRNHHWIAGATESAVGLATIAAALKLAEKNILRLK
jgi:hypothetical protein